ncbi:tetratricopeptide repeat protein [Sphingomicrobium sp. XHP0235]|uniref:tetratricopeptide repeat protein n=1 Tax=Sphingomicrobium aquimarinum TaxID=3133971 RepID=UPI0031FEF6BB
MSAATPAGAQNVSIRFNSVDSPYERYVSARAADLLGEPDRAAELYADWLASGASMDGELEDKAVRSAIAAGRFDIARSIAGQSAAPEALGLDMRLLMLGDALREANYGRALEVLVDPESEVDLSFIEPFVRGWIDAETRSREHATRAARRLAAIAENRPLSRQAPEQAALLALAAGDAAFAIPRIDEALARSGPRETHLRMAFAERLEALGRPDIVDSLLNGDNPIRKDARARLAAGEPIGQAVTHPAEAYAELLLAIAIDIARSGGGSDMPILLAQVARATAPDSASAAIVTGALLENGERTDQAIDLYAAVPRQSPLAPQASDSLAQALISVGRVEEAITLATEAARELGAGASIFARLGDTLTAAERHEEAADAYAKARGLSGDPDWQLLFLEASARFEAGDWPAARSLFQSALALRPQEPLILNFLGYAMLENGEETGLASALIRKASTLAPDSPNITDSLGWALYKTGDADGALEALERASRQAPADPEIHEHYGDVLYAAGRRIEARFAWEAALTYAEKPRAIERMRDKLIVGLTSANASP